MQSIFEICQPRGEVLKGELKEGDELIIGSAARSAARPGMGPGGMGGRPPGR